jgi:transglycosylase-like protein with SLT domain
MHKGIVAVLVLVGCDAASDEIEWVTPDDGVVAPVGDAVELAVTPSTDGVAVRFTVDDIDVGTCDPSQPDEDCRLDDVWRWTVVFDRPGDHVVKASFATDHGIVTATRVITAVPMVPVDDDIADDSEPLANDDGGGTVATDDVPDDLAPLAAVNRGLLDPDRAFHSIFGGIQWRVLNQRVRLHSGIPMGSVAEVKACMNRFGGSIRKWADHFKLSRASVAATALTESNCTNPAGSSDGLSSGPMQVTASTCAAITGLSRTTCRVRMHTHPDFSFEVGAKYMGSTFQRNQHHRDPPKIAAAYNAGSLRKSFANRWHMVTTGNHIDRFVRHYNAYRVWEGQ